MATFQFGNDGQYYSKTRTGTTPSFKYKNSPGANNPTKITKEPPFAQFVPNRFHFGSPPTTTNRPTLNASFLSTGTSQPSFKLPILFGDSAQSIPISLNGPLQHDAHVRAMEAQDAAFARQLDSIEQQMFRHLISKPPIKGQAAIFREYMERTVSKSMSKERLAAARVYRKLRSLARGGVVNEVIYRVANWVFGWEKAAIKRLMKQAAKQTIKRAGKLVVKGAAQQTTIGVGRIVSNIRPRIELDTSRFDRALRDYMTYTKKDFVDVVNQKAFWSVIGALKKTYNADKQVISSELDAPSDKFNGLTVAQAMALVRLRKDGNKNPKKSEINALARRIKNARRKAVGFLKSGWLPAVQLLAPFAPSKAGNSTQGLSVKNPKGSAKPATPSARGVNAEASFWNSIVAGGDVTAHNYMVTALEESMNEQAADMEAYVRRKMNRNAERFNRA